MPEHTRLSSLSDYLQVIRRQRWLILLVTLLFGGVAYALVADDPKTYQAEASLLARSPTQDLTTIGVPDVNRETTDQAAIRAAALLLRPAVLQRAAERAGFVPGNVTTRQETRTSFVVITVTDGDPTRAATAANALAEVGIEVAQKEQRDRFDEIIERATDDLSRISTKTEIGKLQRSNYNVQITRLRTARAVTEPLDIIRPASVQSTPIAPKPVRTTVLGTLGGFVFALLLAFGRFALDRRLHGPNEAADLSGLPLLGSVRSEALGTTALPDDSDASRIDLESFRIIRTGVGHLDETFTAKRVLVTSPLPEEGKSTVAASLAVTTALQGRRVLLVDCDLRRPVLAERLGLPKGPGLAEFLAGDAEPKEILRRVELPQLSRNGARPDADHPTPALAMISAGEPTDAAAELLGTERFATFVKDVGDVYDLVVFDSCPVLPLVDTVEIVPHIDVIVLCVRVHRTTREQLKAVLKALRRLPPRPTGLVATGVKPGRDRDDNYSSYAYAYAAETRTKASKK